MIILTGAANMPPKIPSTSSCPYGEREGIIDRTENDDRLPLHIAGPIIVALSLSLWDGIGFVIHTLL
jgi:hypothetical protein